jgi:hypothetical protein
MEVSARMQSQKLGIFQSHNKLGNKMLERHTVTNEDMAPPFSLTVIIIPSMVQTDLLFPRAYQLTNGPHIHTLC